MYFTLQKISTIVIISLFSAVSLFLSYTPAFTQDAPPHDEEESTESEDSEFLSETGRTKLTPRERRYRKRQAERLKSWKCQQGEDEFLDYRTDSCIDKVFGNTDANRAERLSGRLFFIDDPFAGQPPWDLYHQDQTKSLFDVLHPKGSTDFSLISTNVSTPFFARHYRTTPKNSVVSASVGWWVGIPNSGMSHYDDHITEDDLKNHGCLIITTGNLGLVEPLSELPMEERIGIKRILRNKKDICVLAVAGLSPDHRGRHSFPNRGVSSSGCGEYLKDVCLHVPAQFNIPTKKVDGSKSFGNRIYSGTSSAAPYAAEVFARTLSMLPKGTDVKVVRDMFLRCTFGFVGTEKANKRQPGGRLSLTCLEKLEVEKYNKQFRKAANQQPTEEQTEEE